MKETVRKQQRRMRRGLKLGSRHSNLFYVFLACIMVVGPPMLLTGGGATAQYVWIAVTFGTEASRYTAAVEQWGLAERERFQRAAPAFVLNSTLPGVSVAPTSALALPAQPEPSRVAGGHAYLPLRYSLRPPVVFYGIKWREHLEVVKTAAAGGAARHQSRDELGFGLYASTGQRHGSSGGAADTTRHWVAAVQPLPLLRERRERMASVRCGDERGLYDFRSNICTKMQQLRRICVVIRPTALSGLNSLVGASGWTLVSNHAGVGCDTAVYPGGVKTVADTVHWGAEGGGGKRGGEGAPAGFVAAATIYTDVYLGEFLEESAHGEIDVVVVSTADPDFVAAELPTFALLGPGARAPSSYLPLRTAVPVMLLGMAMSAPWLLCLGRVCPSCVPRACGGGGGGKTEDRVNYEAAQGSPEERNRHRWLDGDVEEPMERARLLGRGSGEGDGGGGGLVGADYRPSPMRSRRSDRVGRSTSPIRYGALRAGTDDDDHASGRHVGATPGYGAVERVAPPTPWSGLSEATAKSEPRRALSPNRRRDKIAVSNTICPEPMRSAQIAPRRGGQGDWVAVFDQHGQRYYHNERTNRTAWTIPAILTTLVPPPSQANAHANSAPTLLPPPNAVALENRIIRDGEHTTSVANISWPSAGSTLLTPLVAPSPSLPPAAPNYEQQ
eukprot:SAG25_NODE_1703_length_2518_cov_2.019430_1_plen_670_part_10